MATAQMRRGFHSFVAMDLFSDLYSISARIPSVAGTAKNVQIFSKKGLHFQKRCAIINKLSATIQNRIGELSRVANGDRL